MANSTQSNHHKQCSMPRWGEPQSSSAPPRDAPATLNLQILLRVDGALEGGYFRLPFDIAMPKSSGQLSPLSMASVRPEASSEQSILAELLPGVVLGRLPDGQTECDLVDEVGEIVDQIERVVVHAAHEISEIVAQGVDGPTDRDNQTHGVERALDMRAHLLIAGCHVSSLAQEDLEEDEPPSAHAEAKPLQA